MPSRKIILAQGEVYHIFNRGVAKNPIFSNNFDYIRFTELVDYYRFEKATLSFSHFKNLQHDERKWLYDSFNERRISLYAYCLMPNHFHFLIKQLSNDGISIFMRKLQNGYAKYFNIKYKRVGPLFQSAFKAVRIESDEQLLHVSRYIHLNPSTAYLTAFEDVAKYPWSSLSAYLAHSSLSLVERNEVLAFFNKDQTYNEFIFDQASYQRELNNIKHLLLE